MTAFSEYAISAFRCSATDYLLKPVKVDELVEAVNKVHKELSSEQNNLNLMTLMDSLAQNNNHKLVIPNLKGFVVIKTNDLIMCEADGYCTHFYLSGKTRVTSSKNLKYYEEVLDQQKIIRVHRSYLVNLSHVKSYSHQGEIHLSENISCPLGNNYKQHFLEVLGKSS